MKLNTTAKATLKSYGVSQAEWARRHFTDGRWHGDACGCPDSRCIGYHHDGPDDCGCLPALLEPGTGVVMADLPLRPCARCHGSGTEPSAPEPPAHTAPLTKLSARRHSPAPERPPGQNQCPAIMPGPGPAIGEYQCELGPHPGYDHCFAGMRWGGE